MASTKISALSNILAASITATDVVPLVDADPGTPVTYKAQMSQLRTSLLTASVGSGWDSTDYLALGAGTFPTTGMIRVGQGSLTGASAPFINSTATWNNAATTFTHILISVSDTASNAASLLLSLQAGAAGNTSVWKVTKAGAVTQASTLTVSAGGITVTAGTTAVQAVTATTGVYTGSLTTNALLSANNAAAGAIEMVHVEHANGGSITQLSVTPSISAGVTLAVQGISGGSGALAFTATTATLTSTTATQWKVAYDGSNHFTTDVSSAGVVTFNATGASAGFTFSDSLTLNGGAVTLTGAATTVTMKDATAATLVFSTASGTYVSVDTRTTASAVIGVTTSFADVTIGSGAASRYTGVSVAGGTINFSGTTSITQTGSQVARGMAVAAITVNGTSAAGGLAITEVASFIIAGPPTITNTGGQTTTVTRAYGLRITTNAVAGSGGAVTDAWALRVDAPTTAGTGNYAAFLNGDTTLMATMKFYLDASSTGQGGNTYLIETSGDVVDLFVGAASRINVTTVGVKLAGGLSLSGGTIPSNGIQFGTSAPGALANGQIWYDGTDLKARLAGATKTITVA